MDLSIIIPVFNGEKFIKKSIYSIVNQIKENNNIEIIVVDDGSTDETKKICESLNIKNLKVINTQNKGVSVARNIGINSAQGNYIMFVDADDYLDDCWYNVLEKYINNTEYDIVFFGNNLNENLRKR